MSTETTRRTKRRYAHELYPHGDEWEVRPLAVEVPYLYAIAMGLEVWGTGWFDKVDVETTDRTIMLGDARRTALMADAMLQGLTGDEAWTWVVERAADEAGELVYERAEHYGVNPKLIKPYECGPERDRHDHLDAPDAHGWSVVHRIEGKESECEECTEPIEPPNA